MNLLKKISGLCYFIFSTVFLSSCSATLNPDKFGHDDPSQPFSPKITVAAVGSISKADTSAVSIIVNIDAGSLRYNFKGSKLVARTKILFEIIDIKKQEVAFTKYYSVNINRELTSDLGALGSHKLSKNINLPPGEYKICISAEDKSTGETSSSTTTALIPKSNKKTTFLTDVQLYGFDPSINGYEPLNKYSLQAKFDTLRLTVQVSIPKGISKPLQMSSKLIQFRSDTLPARSIGDPNYSVSSIYYKGVNYNQKKILQTTDRKLSKQGIITVEFNYPTLEQGNYRFEVLLKKSSLGRRQRAYRDFGIKSVNFPALISPRDKAQTLIYLMNNKDHERLISIQNSDSLERAVNEFWYDHIGSRSKAIEVREKYYDRATIANKEFSNFKEGWKTDRGMIFILFGNPWILDKDFGKQSWYYSYNRLDEEKKFTFSRTKVKNKAFPFNNYLLQRKFLYNNVLYQQKRLWFTGQILDTQI